MSCFVVKSCIALSPSAQAACIYSGKPASKATCLCNAAIVLAECKAVEVVLPGAPVPHVPNQDNLPALPDLNRRLAQEVNP
eukprot:scaffold268671_cov18-Tisochrysis_lutea.AAC.1